jgi:hypothetical protein
MRAFSAWNRSTRSRTASIAVVSARRRASSSRERAARYKRIAIQMFATITSTATMAPNRSAGMSNTSFIAA